MNGKGNDARVRASRDVAAAEGRAQGLDVGWAVSGYLISGMVAYGGIGWLIGHWLHATILFPVGMLTGLVLAIVLIIYRYGRP